MDNNPYDPPEVDLGVALSGSEHAVEPSGPMWVLFSFQGRIPRRVFWGAQLVTILFWLVLLTVLSVIYGNEPRQSIGQEAEVAVLLGFLVFYVPMCWVTLAVQAKRWHDRNKSGWWFLINFIPVVGPLFSLGEVGCARGTVGANRYGLDPT